MEFNASSLVKIHKLNDYIGLTGNSRIRAVLPVGGAGEYVEDDMAIDGGDAAAIIRGSNADTIFDTIQPVLAELPFMREAQVTLIYGPIGDGSPKKKLKLQAEPRTTTGRSGTCKRCSFWW